MDQTVNRACWSVVRLALLVSSVPLGSALAPAWGAEKQSAIFELLLPADAELEVDGYKTQTTGERRRFQSPPVEPDGTYAYSIRATWRGRTVTRRIQLRPERVTTLDLRQELQPMLPPVIAPPTPIGSFSLLVPPAMTLNAGQKVVLPLRVKRFHFPGSIRITFERLPEGVTIENVTLAENHTEAHANVFAAADVPPGTSEINVLASSSSNQDAATMQITVTRAEAKPDSKPDIKPETKPESKTKSIPETKREDLPSHPQLQMVLPDRVELEAGRTQYVEVQVKTVDGSPLPGEPTVSLAAASHSPLRSVVWTVSAFKASQLASTAGFAVSAEPSAAPGDHDLQVVATAGANTIKRSLKVTIKPPPAVTVATPKPAPVLRVVSPVKLVLWPGQTKYVEVKVTTESGEALPAEPVITLASSLDDKMTCTPWTASDFNSSPAAYAMGFAVKAAPDAREGERKVKVWVAAGPVKAESSFQVAVQPPERKPEPEAPPAAALQLVLPNGVELVAGRTRYIEVQVRTADGSPLPGEPSVTVETPGAGLRTVPWTASGFKAGQNVYTAGFAVTADPEATTGECGLKIAAVAGRSKAERTLKITVKPPSPKRAATP